MTELHLLLQGPKNRVPRDLPEILSTESNSTVLADLTEGAQDLVTRISSKRYDAAVCFAEVKEDLEPLIQIRAAIPDLPILMLLGAEDGLSYQKALQLGATAVVLTRRTPLKASLIILQALAAGSIAEAIKARSGSS